MLTAVKSHLQHLQEELPPVDFRTGQSLFINGQCQTLSQGKNLFSFLIDDEFGDFQVDLEVDEYKVNADTKGKKETAAPHLIACLMQLTDELSRNEVRDIPAGKLYTREGMMRRVLAERKEKALKAEYRMAFASNPYGEHSLTNEKGVRYKLTFHDLVQETGYCSCQDYRTNKLGTCKHLMFAYFTKKGDKNQLRKPRTPFPFVEIGLDPLSNYQIRWFHPDPEQISEEIQILLKKYFGDGTHLPEDGKKLRQLLYFTQVAETQHKEILIRPEVYERIEQAYEDQMLNQVAQNHKMDLSIINATLYPYQLKGVKFAAYKKGAIIADEMGLGKNHTGNFDCISEKRCFWL